MLRLDYCDHNDRDDMPVPHRIYTREDLFGLPPTPVELYLPRDPTQKEALPNDAGRCNEALTNDTKPCDGLPDGADVGSSEEKCSGSTETTNGKRSEDSPSPSDADAAKGPSRPHSKSYVPQKQRTFVPQASMTENEQKEFAARMASKREALDKDGSTIEGPAEGKQTTDEMAQTTNSSNSVGGKVAAHTSSTTPPEAVAINADKQITIVEGPTAEKPSHVICGGRTVTFLELDACGKRLASQGTMVFEFSETGSITRHVLTIELENLFILTPMLEPKNSKAAVGRASRNAITGFTGKKTFSIENYEGSTLGNEHDRFQAAKKRYPNLSITETNCCTLNWGHKGEVYMTFIDEKERNAVIANLEKYKKFFDDEAV